MGITFWKKGVWVLLFFSLAMNVGFVVTAMDRKIRPGFPPPGGPGGPRGPEKPALKILDRMNLSEGVREKVAGSLRQMDVDHRGFVRLLFKEEKQLLKLMGQPGKIEMEMITPLIGSYSQISKKSALNKAEYIIEIRNLLGSEKSLYLISELKKEFRKRMPKDRPRS